MHVTSYDATGAAIGDTFDFITNDTAWGGGTAHPGYDGDYYTFDDEVANNQVAYVEITFDTNTNLDGYGLDYGSHANIVDNFLFEV